MLLLRGVWRSEEGGPSREGTGGKWRGRRRGRKGEQRAPKTSAPSPRPSIALFSHPGFSFFSEGPSSRTHHSRARRTRPTLHRRRRARESEEGGAASLLFSPSPAPGPRRRERLAPTAHALIEDARLSCVPVAARPSHQGAVPVDRLGGSSGEEEGGEAVALSLPPASSPFPWRARARPLRSSALAGADRSAPERGSTTAATGDRGPARACRWQTAAAPPSAWRRPAARGSGRARGQPQRARA